MRHALKPIDPPYDEPLASIFARYPTGADGKLLSLFRVFANSPRFAGGRGVANLLDAGSPISLRHREIAILRVTALYDCEYEWGVHVSVFSGKAALNDEQVQATRSLAADAPCWQPEEALLIRVVDELCANANLTTTTLAAFQSAWDEAQQLEIMAIVCHYQLVSCVANVARLANEPGAAHFPT